MAEAEETAAVPRLLAGIHFGHVIAWWGPSFPDAFLQIACMKWG